MTEDGPDPRYRNEQSHRAILQAALRLSRERGFVRTSMDAIAKEAGVGKQTIYRWWPSKAAVVVEAIDSVAQNTDAFPDTGDIGADLRTQMHTVATLLGSAAIAPYREVIGAAQSDPTAAKAVLDTLVEPRVASCRERLKKAQRDGEIRPDIDPDDIIELIYAPLYYRLLLHTRPVSVEQVDAVLDLCFTGLQPATKPARQRPTRR